MYSNIIDTHLHAWDFDYADYDWLKDNNTILNRSFHVEEIDEERSRAGVRSAVLVQAANNFEDTDRLLQIAAETDWISGVVGWLPLQDPAATARALQDMYQANPYFKGVRHMIHDEPDTSWLLQPNVIESLRLLARFDIPYDVVGTRTEHLVTALNVAAKVPGLRMVFDHLNQPPIATGKPGEWGKLMKDVASNLDCYAKISGLGTASGNPEGLQEKELLPYLEFILEHFGTDRCFCGSDWPVSLLAGSYSRHWECYINILEKLLKPHELEKVLTANARRFYQLDQLA